MSEEALRAMCKRDVMIESAFFIDTEGKEHSVPKAMLRGQTEEAILYALHHTQCWFPFIIKGIRCEHVRDADEDMAL